MGGLCKVETVKKEEKHFTYKELAEKFKCNSEHARRICIKLFTEGKIERTKIMDESSWTSSPKD